MTPRESRGPVAKRAASTAVDLVSWGWLLWTVYQVGRYGGAVLLDPSTTSRIMAVATRDGIDSAIGLTYTGVWGALVVLAELVTVVAALGASHSHRDVLRRAALLTLVAWALLWLGNSVRMDVLSGGRHALRTAIIGSATVAIALRAGSRWSR